MSIKKVSATIITLFLILLIPACQTNWQVELQINGIATGSIDDNLVKFYVEEIGDGSESVLFAHILYHHGFTLIEKFQLIMDDGAIHTFDWENLAEKVYLHKNGDIIIENVIFNPSAIDISPSPLAADIEMTIMDLAPTMAKVLGFPNLPDAQGQPRSEIQAQHGVFILVDGLQYQKLHELINSGSLPFYQDIEKIHKGLTVFPSITTTATEAFLTGAPPQNNGVYGYGYRSTEMKTLFDLAVEHGKSVTAIEGYSLAFTLQNAEVMLSGDRDGDGYTDDNVLFNSLKVIESEMPDVLFIHFHDVDDLGHSFGPNSLEYEDAIIRVDGYLSQIYDALPDNTFIIIFSDHGMQDDYTGTGGNHGQLTKSTMIIPIIFLEK